jgi:hypothetical protein
MTISPTPNGAGPDTERVFGRTPKTAVGMTALPKATESFRLERFKKYCSHSEIVKKERSFWILASFRLSHRALWQTAQ